MIIFVQYSRSQAKCQLNISTASLSAGHSQQQIRRIQLSRGQHTRYCYDPLIKRKIFSKIFQLVLNRYAEDGISSVQQQQQQPQLPMKMQSPLFSPVQFVMPQQQQQLLLNRVAVDPRMLSPALGLANQQKQQQQQQEVAILRALEQRQLQQKMLDSAAGTANSLSPIQRKVGAFRLSGRRGPMKNRVLVRNNRRNATRKPPSNRLQLRKVVQQQQQQPLVVYQQPQLAQQLALQQQQQQQQLAMQQLQAAAGNIIQQVPNVNAQQQVSSAVKTASVIAQLAAANRMLRAKLAQLEKKNSTSTTTTPPASTTLGTTQGHNNRYCLHSSPI